MQVRKIAANRDSRILRVAAYARVSTDRPEQEESFEAQCGYYTSVIRQNPRWEFAGVYTDPGRSGTRADERPGFLEMMDAARAGRLDVILCKSISRFARNVVDAQKYVLELRRLNVEVRFEKEGLSSFDPSSEMIFSILAAVAQEESRSISANTRWAREKEAERGIRHIGSNHVLGYDEVKGVLQPNGDAWMVRLIFEEYAAGTGIAEIIRRLTDAGAKRMRGEGAFSVAAVQRILRNEIYVGDRLLQKQPHKNYLTHQPDSTIPYKSYYVRDAHAGIVSRDVWDRVCKRIESEAEARRRGVFGRGSAHYLYGVLVCGECGKPYLRRTVTVNGKKGKRWVCAGRNGRGRGGDKGRERCGNPIVREERVLQAIAREMGCEGFDERVFRERVERVEVGDAGDLRVVWR